MTKHDFLKDITNFSNHRLLLWPALEATYKSVLPVVELGSGYGSTPYLRAYCEANKREFFSYDYDKEWAQKMGSVYVDNWDTQGLWTKNYSVCLLDLSPGEYRKIALMKIIADVIVIHDSEEQGWNSSDYKVRSLFNNFKFIKDYIPDIKGAPWATTLSNSINVSLWKLDDIKTRLI